MTFKPPWSLPTSDGVDVGEPVMQLPPSIHFTVDATKAFLDTMGPAITSVADQIVDFYSPNITQFVQQQRRLNAISGIAQASNRMSLPGLDLEHAKNQGIEHIRIRVQPESAPPQSFQITVDVNLDGYVAWVHNWSKFQAPQVDNQAIDFVVNGYGVLTNYTPDDDLFVTNNPPEFGAALTQATVIVIAAFGNTALRCQSLQDDAKGFNPFTKTQGSGGAAPTCVPARKDVPASGPVPSHKDLLGYFIFNWGDRLNPDTWSYNGRQSGGSNQTFDMNFPKEFVIKIIEFKSPQNSPLKPTSSNVMWSQTHNFPPLSQLGQNGVDFTCAEFYNRAVLRSVQRSWKLQTTTPADILLANDKPLYFANDGGDPFSDLAAGRYFAMSFDLSTQKSPADAATFGNANTPTPPAIPITAAMLSVQQANQAAAIAHGAAYTAAYNTLQAAYSALALANSPIMDFAQLTGVGFAYTYVRDPTPAHLSALQTAFPTLWPDLITYAQASIAFQNNPSTANAAALAAAQSASPGVEAVTFGDALGVIANSDAYNYSIAYQVNYDKAIAQGQTIAQAQAAGAAATAQGQTAFIASETAFIQYATDNGLTSQAAAATTAMNNVPPAQSAYITALIAFNPQHMIANNYQGISQFNYRIITVTKGVYSIGPWSQG
jgi:hypothetical protein